MEGSRVPIRRDSQHSPGGWGVWLGAAAAALFCPLAGEPPKAGGAPKKKEKRKKKKKKKKKGKKEQSGSSFVAQRVKDPVLSCPETFTFHRHSQKTPKQTNDRNSLEFPGGLAVKD